MKIYLIIIAIGFLYTQDRQKRKIAYITQIQVRNWFSPSASQKHRVDSQWSGTPRKKIYWIFNSSHVTIYSIQIYLN